MTIKAEQNIRILEGIERNKQLRITNTKLLGALDTAISALHNVPFVGEIYDQQHSDTQTAAALEARAAIAKTKGESS